jgi:hypothetical protein
VAFWLWQQMVSVEGDRDEAARFLNALNLIKRRASPMPRRRE